MGNRSDATPFSANDGAMLAAPNKRVLGASSRNVLCMLDLLERADPCLPTHLMRRRLATERSIGDAPMKSPGGSPAACRYEAATLGSSPRMSGAQRASDLAQVVL